ncbi:tyrosine-type recombinase/integrase [Nocardia xishanensis]
MSLSESGSSRFVGRGLSASRTIQSYQVLSQILRFAIKAKRLAANPADDVDLPTMMSGLRRYLTHVEVMQLAMASGRFRPIVFTLAYTGIRFGEAIALRTADVDLVRNRITINRSAGAGDSGQGSGPHSGWSAGRAAVPEPQGRPSDLHAVSVGVQSGAERRRAMACRTERDERASTKVGYEHLSNVPSDPTIHRGMRTPIQPA